MTISGSSVKRKISDKVSEVENQSEAFTGQVYDLEKKITSLSDEREESFVQLATIYLPELEAKSIQRTLREVQLDVKRIFQEKQEKRTQLEVSMRDSQKNRKTLEGELESVSTELTQKSQERVGLMQKVSKELGEKIGYADLCKKVKEESERLQTYKQRVEEAKTDSAQKLQVYKQNKLFSYLLGRNFNTDAYSAGRITMMLDSWVAGIINFSEAKKNYDFLSSMPELMNIEAERKEEEVKALVQEKEETETEVSEKYGLPKIMAYGSKLEEKRKKIIAGIENEDKSYGGYTQERTELDSTKDPYHIEAIQRLKDFLKGQTIQDLRERARSTPSPDDDKLVEKIEQIDGSVRTLKNKAKEAKTQRDELAKKLEGLKKIHRDFTSKNYDSGRSYFPGSFDVGDLLTGYVLGRMGADDINRDISSHRKLEPEPTYSSRNDDDDSSSYHSSSSHHDSDSGSSFGGFSSGGGFGGGGGFSSGSGF
jgi:chromosome segregation ATPase